MWRAIATMWIGQFDDAPRAAAATTAFSNACFVIISDGRKFSCTIATMRLPVSYAIQPRSRYGAGIAAQPGSDMPRVSAKEFIDVAVPMVLQCPTDGADDDTICMNSS